MPTPTTYQTQMSLYKGQTPAVDENGMIANMSWYPRIVAKTADYTVLSRESGTFFTTTGGTAARNFTLPTIASGPWYFEFFNGADQNMTVTAQTADTIVTFNDLAADSVAVSTSSEKIGGSIVAFTDGTTLFVVFRGASQAQHVTIAT